MKRRRFLTLLAGGAGIVAAAPVRRIWAVGAVLVPDFSVTTVGPGDVVLSHEGEGLAQQMRDCLPETFPTDVRFAKTHVYSPSECRVYLNKELALTGPITLRTEITGEDFRRLPQGLDPELAKYFEVSDDVLDASPIIVSTEIAPGYRS